MSKLRVQMPSGRVSIGDVVEKAPILEKDLIQLANMYANKVINEHHSAESITARFRCFISTVRYCQSNFDTYNLVANGLKGFLLNDYELLKILVKSNIRSDLVQSLIYGLKLFTGNYIDKSYYTDKAYLYLEIGRIEVSDIKNFSEQLYQDLIALNQCDLYQGKLGHDKTSISRRFVEVVGGIRYCLQLDSVDQNTFKTGINSLIENNYSILKSVFLSDISARVFNELVIACSQFLGKSIHKHDYNENLLPFYFKKTGKWRTIDLSYLKENYAIVFDEVRHLHKLEIELLPQRSYDMETLHTRFVKLNRVIVSELIPLQDRYFVDYGLTVLGKNNNKLQKKLFESIQRKVKSGEMSIRAGDSYFGVIRWLMGLLGITVVESFGISYKRYKTHAKRQRMERTYTDNQLRELVFYLEKTISKTTNQKQLVALCFAKIQIKTCWNTSAMIDIEMSDINEIELPTGKKMMSIMIQKPRKGYAIDTYKLDGRTISSVMRDLNHVKDLTQSLRTSVSNFNNYLFVFEEYTILKRLDGKNITSYLNIILSREGCTVTYSSQRLRKTGANHLYKEVEKNIRLYKDALRHTYSTFVKNYQHIEETKTLETLHSAVQKMEDYFKGREISIDITVLEKDDSNLQKTPTGLCSVIPFSTEAAQYHKEHYQLHKESQIESEWCSDYLACIWCKHFRTVADPEHVWQLLSYKDYVLSDMRLSVAFIENNESQLDVIENLNLRVDEMLSVLRQKNHDAVEQGAAMHKVKGVHPYWQFVIHTKTVQEVE